MKRSSSSLESVKGNIGFDSILVFFEADMDLVLLSFVFRAVKVDFSISSLESLFATRSFEILFF